MELIIASYIWNYLIYEIDIRYVLLNCLTGIGSYVGGGGGGGGGEEMKLSGIDWQNYVYRERLFTAARKLVSNVMRYNADVVEIIMRHVNRGFTCNDYARMAMARVKTPPVAILSFIERLSSLQR